MKKSIALQQQANTGLLTPSDWLSYNLTQPPDFSDAKIASITDVF